MTNTMTRKISLSIVAAFLCLNAAFAQTTISGSLDAYYRYNFGKSYGTSNNFTSFTNSQNSFELGMATLKAEHTLGKVSGTLDLGFGKRAQEFSYNDGGSSNNDGTLMQAVKQAYFSYAPSSKVKFTAGKWGTHVGYELLDAYLNKNYSMSYMFTNGPFFHTGVKADITLGGKNTLMVGVANPTDQVTDDQSIPKAAIAQFATASKDDKYKVWVNYVGTFYKSGSENQIGVTATAAVASKFSLGYDGTIKLFSGGGSSASWWGSALYFNYDPKADLGLTLRTEYFSDKSDAILIGDNIFAATLSANYKVGGFSLVPEIRVDNGTFNLFNKADGTPTKTTFTALIAGIYHF